MPTVDRRTRFEGDTVVLDPDVFGQEYLPALLEAHGGAAGRGAQRLGLVPLTLDVDGQRLTFAAGDEQLVVHAGGDDSPLAVALDRDAFSDLMQDVASTFGLQMTGRAEVRRGALDAFVEWEPVLRCLLDGRAVYEPGSIAFRDRAGAPLELQQSFTLDDAPGDIGHFLAEAGFVHIAGMFTEAEMAAVSAELDDAVAAAERDDGASWWARTESGEWYASRILGFNQKSPALRELVSSERFAMIATLTGDAFVQRDPRVGDSAEGLLKKVGVVEGISDVSWHKDCAMGDHSRRCCGLTVGISVTGAGRENGELGAVAGSHRANVAPLGVEGLDLPRVPLPTRTGDVTVHCSCTLHMSRPPVSAERRVVYTGFNLAPRPGDHRAELDPAEVRRQRAALNDHTRRQQQRGNLSARVASHEL
ncbi:MAG TPA: phytanoyl-CoA dioxygenase family protein [Acidimicrobiia bacterium]|nr:phytanoyl-CoA dioxygenase family protein [Acidimicrobiia bacterium]